MFVEGLQKYFQLGANLERMFPRLVDLTHLHLGLLARLRERQRESPIVSTIADILLEQFSSTHAYRLKSAYGMSYIFLFLQFKILMRCFLFKVNSVVDTGTQSTFTSIISNMTRDSGNLFDIVKLFHC